MQKVCTKKRCQHIYTLFFHPKIRNYKACYRVRDQYKAFEKWINKFIGARICSALDNKNSCSFFFFNAKCFAFMGLYKIQCCTHLLFLLLYTKKSNHCRLWGGIYTPISSKKSTKGVFGFYPCKFLKIRSHITHVHTHLFKKFQWCQSLYSIHTYTYVP